MFWKVLRLAPFSVAIYPFLVPIAWLVTLLAYALSPVVAGISMATSSNHVRWLGWFYTHDASLDGGIEQGKDGYDPAAGGWKLWWQRVCWICRNPAYGFVAGPLGFSAEGSTLTFETGKPYPPVSYWTVMELKSGRRIFGYRSGTRWFGWKYTPIAGRHQLKSKPI